MPLYFLLGTLTEGGQTKMQENPNLAVEAVQGCDCEGAEILGQYAVLGKYDFVMMAEAEDNQAVARLSLEMGVRVGLHVETLPALAIGALAEDDPRASRASSESAHIPSEEWRLPPNGPDEPQSI